MASSRRELLKLAALAPLGLAAGAVVASVGAAARSAIPALRPTAAGTTATRCGRCGATDHAMLDPGCPARPRIRRTG